MRLQIIKNIVQMSWNKEKKKSFDGYHSELL